MNGNFEHCMTGLKPSSRLHSLEKLIEWKRRQLTESATFVYCLHSLEKLIEWKRNNFEGIQARFLGGLHSLEKLIEWKLLSSSLPLPLSLSSPLAGETN